MHGVWPASDRERENDEVELAAGRLIGLAWTNVYETLDNGRAGFVPVPPMPSGRRPACSVTSTCPYPGHGGLRRRDPSHALAGTLAWLEAVTGQLYLASRSTAGGAYRSPREAARIPPARD
jgi:hypothetical protein